PHQPVRSALISKARQRRGPRIFITGVGERIPKPAELKFPKSEYPREGNGLELSHGAERLGNARVPRCAAARARLRLRRLGTRWAYFAVFAGSLYRSAPTRDPLHRTASPGVPATTSMRP